MKALVLNVVEHCWKFLLDCVFPKFCFGCDIEGEFVCGRCKAAVKKSKIEMFKVFADLSLDGIWIGWRYKKNEVISKVIHGFKYLNLREIGDFLAKEVFVSCWKLIEEQKIDTKNLLVVYVQIDKNRLNERGYNQCELLCKYIEQWFDCKQVLERVSFYKAQMELNENERKKNVVGVFKFIGQREEIEGRDIIVVDDVATTFSTLNEIAKVLKSAGARRVFGVVVAKT